MHNTMQTHGYHCTVLDTASLYIIVLVHITVQSHVSTPIQIPHMSSSFALTVLKLIYLQLDNKKQQSIIKPNYSFPYEFVKPDCLKLYNTSLSLNNPLF